MTEETPPSDEAGGPDDERQISRRSVLGGAAALGASALAVGASGTARAAAAVASSSDPRVDPARSGIEHVIVVMMENRSFDHMLGWLPGANGIQAGLTFVDHEGVSHPTWHLDTFQGLQYGDPDHSYNGGRTQLNRGACDGWLKAGTDDIFPIGYYEADDLAFYSQAAPYWTVCDHFHASIMGPTFPNRMYMHTAQTDRTSNTLTASTLPAIWDSLAGAGVSGKYYYSDAPITGLFGTRFLPISFTYPQFLADCASGDLPAVSFVDPRFIGESNGTAGDDHPFADIRVGQSFLNDIYTAVTNGPDWGSTVLVITYDEWGGFFDHVVPRSGPDNDPTHALRGFRIPTFVISPFARRHHVAHELFDHTSILAMIEWRWGLPALTPRDAHAVNLARALSFHTPPDLTAPQWVVPSAATIAGRPAPGGTTEHEQDFVGVAEVAAAHGFDV
jgi:phospholipase C